MKLSSITLAALTVAFAATAPRALAHSRSAPQNLSQATLHSAAASGQAVAASGEIAVAALKVTSGAAAVAFWTGGSTAVAAGTVVRTVGDATAHAGASVTHGGDHLWDFASGDPTRRPVADRARSVPPLKQTVRRDPSPAEAMRLARP